MENITEVSEHCPKCGAHDPMGEAAWHGDGCDVAFAPQTEALFEWSQNFDFPNPASLFLDLIGWSEEELGDRLCRDKQPILGYLELDYLADALKEYAKHPWVVTLWVDRHVRKDS